jgi:hypothetical protein
MDDVLWNQMTRFTPLSNMVNEELLPNLKKVEENIWVIKNEKNEIIEIKETKFVWVEFIFTTQKQMC